VYVLCSDGLSGMVSDEDIVRIVAGATDIREACRRLIQRANERGGEDNITAVLIQLEEPEPHSGNGTANGNGTLPPA
jgi:serine/threonine protein phosphatase PrpC